MSEFIAALPLLGVVVGAVMQYWFSRSAESKKQLQLLQSQSYVDYLRAVTQCAHASSTETKKSAKTEVTDAKTRIAVYGASSVVAALAKFEATGANLAQQVSIDAFVRLVGEMRPSGGSAEASDLNLVMFGPERDLPNPSAHTDAAR